MNTTENYIFEQHLININTKWEDFSREIKDIQTPEMLSILYATDIHYIRKYAMFVPAYYRIKEMVEFSKYAGFDLLALTGDIVDGNATLNRQKRDLYDIVSLIREAKTTSILISKGNHDDCSWYAYKNKLGTDATLTQDLWYSYVINPIRVQYPIVVDKNNISGGYYYIDYPLHRIRVININTNDTPIITDYDGKINEEKCTLWNYGIRENQLNWLIKSLQFDEDGWSVIFMSHDFLLNNNPNETLNNGDLAWEIIRAYKDMRKGSLISKEENYEAKINFDFTSNKSNDVLVYMFGHRHKDFHFVEDGITAVGTKNVLGQVNKKWDDLEENIDGGWDCVFIDKKSRILRTKRYGVDDGDRHIVL